MASYVPRRRAGRREFGVDISNVDHEVRNENLRQAAEAEAAAAIAASTAPIKGGNNHAIHGIRKGKRKASEMDMDDVILDVKEASKQPAKRTCRYDLRSRRQISRSNSAAVSTNNNNDNDNASSNVRSNSVPDKKKDEDEESDSTDGIAVHLDDLDMDGPITRSRARRLREQKRMEIQRRRAKSRPNRERVSRANRVSVVRSASVSDDPGSASDSEAMDEGLGIAGRLAVNARRSRAIGRSVFGDPMNRRRRKVKRSMVVPKWDSHDTGNELASVYYASDIVQNLFNSESNAPGMEPVMDYMARQNDLSARMRLILLDWLLDVHRKFDLATATLYLCVSLLDRYLGKPGVQIEKSKLQLTGCACLWIASKYHEIYAPEINDFVYISDDAFTQDELIQKESDIVSALNFNLTVPTPLSFVQRFLKVLLGEMEAANHNNNHNHNHNHHKRSHSGGRAGRSGPNEKFRLAPHLTHYLLEHAIMHYEMSTRYKPSQISAAAVCYASLCLQIENQWPVRMQQVTGYTVIELKPIIVIFDKILKSNPATCKHKAVRKKYGHSRFGRVSLYQYRGFSVSGWEDEMTIHADEEDL